MSVLKVIARNKKAKFNYFIEDTFEAGIVLKGSEVKSLREGKCSIEDSHADYSGGHIILYNCHIQEYEKANRFNHIARRPRVLLLNKKEIRKIIGKIKIKGYSLIATSIYFNNKNMVKIELAIAKGKKLYDKREDIKAKDWKREQERAVKVKV
jgi:SsrA-binding protein